MFFLIVCLTAEEADIGRDQA